MIGFAVGYAVAVLVMFVPMLFWIKKKQIRARRMREMEEQ